RRGEGRTPQTAEDVAVWTPKRVLLLGTGAAVFLVGYITYAFFLGGIDGLARLPEALEAGTPIPPPAGSDNSDSDIDKKLRLAFGKECRQCKMRIKLEVRKKGLVIAAAEAS